MAGFATRASFAGHTSRSPTTGPTLTFNPDHLMGAGQARFRQCTEQPLRQRSGFQSDPLEVVAGVCQHPEQIFWFARYLHFPNDSARVIHNADAGLLD